MGASQSSFDDETAPGGDIKQADIFLSQNLMNLLKPPIQAESNDDDYPIDVFQAKGFIEDFEEKSVETVQSVDTPPESTERADSVVYQVEKIAADIISRHPIVTVLKQRPCQREQEEARQCLKVKSDELQCAGLVRSYLQCSRESVTKQIATI